MLQKTIPFDLLRHEEVLLRFFRCMTADEQGELLLIVLKTLGCRCSLDPHYSLSNSEDYFSKELTEELDDRLMSAWPSDWPGQQVVDLDFTGDPGAWLMNNLHEVSSTYLFRVPMDDLHWAEAFGESYLHTIREQGYPLPSDFGDDSQYNGWTDEDEATVRSEFAAFLDHWRECVIVTLEKQAQSSARP